MLWPIQISSIGFKLKVYNKLKTNMARKPIRIIVPKKGIRDKVFHIRNFKNLNIYKGSWSIHLSPTDFKLETHDIF